MVEYPKALFTEDGYQIPFGFPDESAYRAFVDLLRAGLPDEVEPVFQGSAASGVKGVSSKTIAAGTPFDVDRHSDFDIGLIDKALFEKAGDIPNVRSKSDPNRIGPVKIGSKLAVKLNLDELLRILNVQSGRRVEFMLYPTAREAYQRGPIVPVPGVLK